MAYYSKYSGKEVDERLDRVDSIPTKISQLLNDKDYITEIELKAILDKIPIVDFSKIPIDEDTIYWSENSDGKLVLKSKGEGDSNWSVKKDSNGNKYIYTELPVVTQYGVTMYGNSGDINLPSLYAGLPIDNQTIYWDNGVLKSLGGGGEGLDEEALRNYLLINGYATESWVLNLGYIGPEGLKNYVDISSNQDINGKKNFKSGISINGLDIYQSQDDVIYLDANLVVRGGITMFANGGNVDIPSIAQGLPFDNRTIWYNPNTNQIEVIGGTGGGSGEGVSNFWDLSGIPSWITNSKPKYSYSEIEGTPDLSVYAQVDALKAYVTLAGAQTLTGEKNFTGGLKVNGSPIYYDTEKKYWKLEGDLLVTGGVTMYGNEGTFTPSTIMDAILYDDATLGINSNGQLYVKGGTSGGGLDITALQNYLTQNSYLNVTSGDNRYLKLSGGTISNNGYALILNRESESPAWIQFRMQNEFVGAIGGENGALRFMDKNSIVNTVWHSGNFNPSNYLPLSGGTMIGNILLGGTTTNKIGTNIVDTTGGWQEFTHQNSHGYIAIGPFNDSVAHIYTDRPSFFFNKDLYVNNAKVWNAGNDGSGSTLDADLLDGKHLSDIIRYEGLNNNGNNAASAQTITYWGEGNWGHGSTYGTSLNIQGAGSWNHRIDFRTDGKIDYYQGINTGDMSYIGQLAFTSSNVASATKLQTARTIWGQSFDGTGNVSGAITNVNFILSNTTNGYFVGNREDGAGASEGGLMLYTYGKTPISIWVGGSERMRITSSGDVGIGTTTPSYKLNVNGNCLVSNSNRYVLHVTGTDGNGGLISFGGTNGSEQGHFGYSRLNSLYMFCYAAYRANQNGVTALGIDSDSNLFVGTGGDPSINQSKMVIRASGNVGIGTSTPERKLVVSNNGAEGLELSWDSTYGSILTYNRSTKQFLPFSISASVVNIGVTGVTCNLLVTGGITMYSDQRKKTILNHVELSLKDIANAPLIEHYYNGDDKKTTHVGSIAQYWASMNDWFCKLDNEGYYTMEIQNAALASAISIARELDRYETKTDKAIKKLKKRICELEEEVERLKAS